MPPLSGHAVLADLLRLWSLTFWLVGFAGTKNTDSDFVADYQFTVEPVVVNMLAQAVGTNAY